MSSSTTSDAIDLLASIFPDRSRASLATALSTHSGSLERTTNALLSSGSTKGSATKRKREAAPASGLGGWLTSLASTTPKQRVKDVIPAGDDGYRRPRVVKGSGSSGANAFTSLKPPPSAAIPSTPTSLPPLNLCTAELIRQHTGGRVELVERVLSKELAARLFLTMVRESQGSDGGAGWEKNRWYLADRQVESPHTTAFYVEAGPTPTCASSDTYGYDAKAFQEAARYWYNGEERSARIFNSDMDAARLVIEPLVQARLATRPVHVLTSKLPWTPNVAAANCYRGAKESVGWHSDVLTYLGPRPVIASLSLGVERTFRLRAASAAASPRTLSISLPHNSLLIMHEGCQETFKHCVAEGKIDLFRLASGTVFQDEQEEQSNTAGWRERINMTFRHYRPDFAPLPAHLVKASVGRGEALALPYAGTPICHCGTPTSLRPDLKGKVQARLGQPAESCSTMPLGSNVEDDILYFWTCNAGGQNEGKTCSYFRLLDMEAEGRGEWFRPLATSH